MPSAKRVGFISLGCPKNQVDLEIMLGRTANSGYEIVSSLDDADIVVINTCSFIEDAVQESDGQIREVGRWKERGRVKRILVTGCLPAYLKESFYEKYPFVDGILNPGGLDRIGDLLADDDGIPPLERLPDFKVANYLYSEDEHKLLTTNKSLAYVKISDGCSHCCSFCIIPKLRGGTFRSRGVSSVTREVRGLIAQGVKEIVLVSQDSSSYGADIGTSLEELLRALASVPGDFWVRVMYLYPGRFTTGALKAFSEHPDRILPYFDIPFQHINDRILKLMNRQTDSSLIRSLIAEIREAVPQAVIRTTFIVGFPGEKEAEFEEMLSFLSEARFDKLTAFTYSDIEGAASKNLKDKVSKEISDERKSRLMKAQMAISVEINRQQVGREFKTLVESRRRDNGRATYIGRSYRDANGIDGVIIISSEKGELELNRFYNVKIRVYDTYDLFGEVLTEPDR